MTRDEFTQTYERMHRRLVGVAAYWMRGADAYSRTQAEDCVQAAFVRMLEPVASPRYERYRPGKDFETLMVGAVIYAVRDALRRRYYRDPRRHKESGYLAVETEYAEREGYMPVAAGEHTTDDTWPVVLARWSTMLAAICQTPLEHEAAVGVWLDGRRVSEVAYDLAVTTAAVRDTLTRVRRRISETMRLDKDNGGLPLSHEVKDDGT